MLLKKDIILSISIPELIKSGWIFSRIFKPCFFPLNGLTISMNFIIKSLKSIYRNSAIAIPCSPATQ